MAKGYEFVLDPKKRAIIEKCPYYYFGECALEFHHEKTCPSEKCICADTFGYKGDRKMDDLISRRGGIDALWKALFEYEDKTEKQFLDSDELDLSDWMIHRSFVQDMSDIDRETILNLPSAQPEPLTDAEQRIFLSAMEREREVCRQVDEEYRNLREPYEDSLVRVCNEIERKVKGALWV